MSTASSARSAATRSRAPPTATRRLFGYHPILATRADTREALHIRLRKGSANTQKGIKRFCEELIARVERAGATGVEAAAGRLGVLEHEGLRAAGAGGLAVLDRRPQHQEGQGGGRGDPPRTPGRRIPYPDGGEAQIAETVYGGRRLIVRRTRLLGAQAELFPDWRHFAFLTNRTDDIAIVEAEHRDHAVVEQVIADLKDQALAHFPSGHFYANGAWTVLAASRTTCCAGRNCSGCPTRPSAPPARCAAGCSRIPGRLTRHARGWTLHLPARWPWHGDYISALNAHPRAPRRRLTAHRATTDNQTLRHPPPARERRPRAPPNVPAERRRAPTAPPTRHDASNRAAPQHPRPQTLTKPPDRWLLLCQGGRSGGSVAVDHAAGLGDDRRAAAERR